MKILITGSRGQLGNELTRCLGTMTAEIGAIDQAYNGAICDAIDYDVLDISDAHAVHNWYKEHGAYDLTINCAAITNVDGCETAEAAAYHVNACGPENLAREVARTGGKLVQVSTDYVFPGTEPEPRKEDDPIAPISGYGRTKWAGEVLALAACERTFVCRTAWLYGYVGRNFVKTMRKLGAIHDRVAVVDDQIGNPTSANDLAYHILKVALTKDYGTYHMTNEGTCSWADFAARIMERSGLACEVVPVTSEQYKQMNPASADRPHYSSLENARLAATVGNEFRPWRDAIDQYIERLPELEG